jgi:hypothetical protein
MPQLRKIKGLVPLSHLLNDDCLGDIVRYADMFYLDIGKKVISQNCRKNAIFERKEFAHNSK